jgi:hypothetical protein
MSAPAPSAWALAYVGLPYIVGVGECAQRAALVWRQRFGLAVAVSPAWGDRDRAEGLIAAAIAGPGWARVPQPREGDAVVMRKGGRLAHVGVWVEPGHVLHCTRAEGMVLTREADLPDTGFAVEGYYRWREKRAQAA